MCGEQGQDFGFREVETEGFESDFEFMVVYPLVFIQIEKSKLSPTLAPPPIPLHSLPSPSSTSWIGDLRLH